MKIYQTAITEVIHGRDYISCGPVFSTLEKAKAWVEKAIGSNTKNFGDVMESEIDGDPTGLYMYYSNGEWSK